MSSESPFDLWDNELDNAVSALRAGGVIAYPTEYCFGLGCDPRNQQAVEKLLTIKGRSAEQGVILIAGDLPQVACYADLEKVPDLSVVTDSWPGSNTWLLPALEQTPRFIRGKHSSIAMRIPKHDFCLAMLAQFGHPIVSTSANRSGEKEHLCADTVRSEMAQECDYIVDVAVGGAKRASCIRDAITGEILR